VTSGLSFAVLDSIRAWRGGVELDLGSPQQRATLVFLLLHEGRSVSTDALADALWGEAAPRTARGTLRTYVHRLRRVLEADDENPVIVSVGSGYAIDVDPKMVDLGLFQHLVDTARTTREQGKPAEAAELLQEGLKLWGTTPLAGIQGEYIDDERARLHRLRIGALEELLDMQLSLGRPGDVANTVFATLPSEPLRERLHELLILALYRSGRQAEALVAYDDARKLFRRELGVDPGPGLQDLYERILRSDPTLLTEAGDPGVTTVSVKPAQLPADLSVFVGRKAALAEALALLPSDGRPAPDTVVGVVSGTAGVGKTAFAIRWAHQVADRFPDGQLYVNLRGFDSGGAALDPGEAIRWFLEALGVPADRVPDDLHAQAALYRSVLSGKRCLILLDNARDADQVSLLVPGAPGCLAIVTSRHQLPGLVAATGAHPMSLDLLSEGEADEFLARRLGADKVGGEPRAAQDIATVCARLPLALAIVSARAASHANFPLSAIAAELFETRGSLDAFAGTDSTTDVRAVFSWSYQALSPAAARMFELLSLHPGTEISSASAANLGAVSNSQARIVLRELANTHLLTEQAPGRYTWHDLLRTYAREILDEHGDHDEHHAAVRRLLDYYAHTADAGLRLFTTYRDLMRLEPPAPGVRPEVFADYEHALAWLITEYPVLLGIIDYAVANGFDLQTGQLARALQHFQDRQGHWLDLAATQTAALAAARRLGDRSAIAFACGGIARADSLLLRHVEAHQHLDEAAQIYTRLGDPISLAYNQTQRASVYNRQGKYSEALHHCRRALALCREAGYEMGEAAALNNVGWYLTKVGEHEQAIDYCRRALIMYERLDNRVAQANALDSLAYVHYQLGNFEEAVELYRHGLPLLRALGDRSEEIDTLINLGDAYAALGRREDARAALLEALTVMEDLDFPDTDRIRVKLLRLDSSTPSRFAS
jgi:DNA-binding SARP family transcriptional activator